ncbi:hypothetical protein A3850_017480 [Lewinella sp. 4G2]|nr:hypothetical protein A3850_017480 [Lewinella sp. 4G2]
MGSTLFKPVPPVDLAGRSCVSLDLSSTNFALPELSHLDRLPAFEEKITALLTAQRADFGIGGYGEVRSLYTTDDFSVLSNGRKTYRTVHLGIDVWGAASTPVVAPLDGKVYLAFRDATTGGYGPTLILEHRGPGNLPFYTLYGHLDESSLTDMWALPQVRSGDQIATFGGTEVNGNWPPHLHFQVITDWLSYEPADFPGVALASDAERLLAVCPDPAPFFG